MLPTCVRRHRSRDGHRTGDRGVLRRPFEATPTPPTVVQPWRSHSQILLFMDDEVVQHGINDVHIDVFRQCGFRSRTTDLDDRPLNHFPCVASPCSFFLKRNLPLSQSPSQPRVNLFYSHIKAWILLELCSSEMFEEGVSNIENASPRGCRRELRMGYMVASKRLLQEHACRQQFPGAMVEKFALTVS